MKKDQFWQIIDAVNEGASYQDEETHFNRVMDTLSRHSLDDIKDWYLIFEEYSRAACRNDLWAASAALGAHCTDDGFVYFRSWLISRGRDVYMNAMRDPDSLASIPRPGEDLNFERFAYAPYYAYEAKLFRIDPDRQEDLYSALESHVLNQETLTEIREEIPQRPDIRNDWARWMLPGLFPKICKAREPKDLEGLLNAGDLAFGYVYQGKECTEYVFQNTPKNLANFIGSHPEARQITVANEWDCLILNTVGWFIDRCPSQELLEEVKKTLIPIQMSVAEPQPFFCPTMDEMETYCEQKKTMEQQM